LRQCGRIDVGIGDAHLSPVALVEKLKELAVNDPYSGKTVTGGIITFTDSNWVMSVTCNRQPHFPASPTTCWFCGSMRC
jgi:myosin-crossreactive antigen